MDSLTHIVLGACIGEAFFEKGFGKKAMLWGALAQSIPDVDFISTFWLSTPESLLAHRGFTHSILFALLMIPLFSLTAAKIHKTHAIAFQTWLLFFGTELFVHLFLDGFNNYGVGWFEPFSHLRFSFNTLYVADPFFSIWAGIGFCMLLLLHKHHPKRTFWWKFGVWLPLVYLCYCTVNKIIIDKKVKGIFARQHIPHEHYFTSPAPLQNWVWYVVSGNDSGFYTGYISVFDTKPETSFRYFPKMDSLLKPLSGGEDLQHLIRFSQGFYTVEKWKGQLVFNDLRFGQINGWSDPEGKFVFHYFLQFPEENKMVVQRGRFMHWDKRAWENLWQRIRGN